MDLKMAHSRPDALLDSNWSGFHGNRSPMPWCSASFKGSVNAEKMAPVELSTSGFIHRTAASEPVDCFRVCAGSQGPSETPGAMTKTDNAAPVVSDCNPLPTKRPWNANSTLDSVTCFPISVPEPSYVYPPKRAKMDHSSPDSLGAQQPEEACQEAYREEDHQNIAETDDDLKMISEEGPDADQTGSPDVPVNLVMETASGGGCVELENSPIPSAPADGVSSRVNALGKCRTEGVSLLYSFTAEELKEHMSSLRQNPCSGNPVREDSHEHKMPPDENTCSLCEMTGLHFEPPPRYCAFCSKLIKSRGVYYAQKCGNDNLSVCAKCYNISGNHLKSKTGLVLQKFNFEKRYNYADTDAEAEWWVQCDKCRAWQHVICALCNRGTAEAEKYVCAKCLLTDIENGVSYPWEQSVFRAQDLPKTVLSDHIEQWLFNRLNEDRQQRADSLKKSIDEVQGVEGLCVRVVSSVSRSVKVLPRFRDFMKQRDYAEEFPYRSKAILLFQNIDGVDVCIFAMYVQEYGANCPPPNQRHIYLAYIDSVKYFRPAIKSATGEALRTLVYHSILIGYFDYCRRRGYISCSIWACPSSKNNDYVLHCHPTSQQMPKAEKLRAWYQILINKALKENVVVERGTLHNCFIEPTNESKINVSAAGLPYCENDFWPGEVEKLLEEREKDASKEMAQYKRLIRVAKRDERKGEPEDILLLHKLGERMRPAENFLMVYLQHVCKHCCLPMLSGKRWICTSCKNFHLCDQCYAEEERCPLSERHPVSSRQKHTFERVVEEPLPDTNDGDLEIESRYFDSRTDFLKFCEENQFQFDSLRRAKHSTMMIIYHLNRSPCSSCHLYVDASRSWRCPSCRELYLCDSCYRAEGKASHCHRLFRPRDRLGPSIPQGTLKPNDGRRGARSFTDFLVGVLVHASRCLVPSCTRDYCRQMKLLFHHGAVCKVRYKGGCVRCINMWCLLRQHFYGCKDQHCSVPRCKDYKDDRLRKLNPQHGS